MTDKKDFILYGIAGVVAIIAVILGYAYFKRIRNETRTKSHVMNKIQDFYSTQDTNKEPNINY